MLRLLSQFLLLLFCFALFALKKTKQGLEADDVWRQELLGQRLDLVRPQKADVGGRPEVASGEVRDDGSERWHDPASGGRDLGFGFGWLGRLDGRD